MALYSRLPPVCCIPRFFGQGYVWICKIVVRFALCGRTSGARYLYNLDAHSPRVDALKIAIPSQSCDRLGLPMSTLMLMLCSCSSSWHGSPLCCLQLQLQRCSGVSPGLRVLRSCHRTVQCARRRTRVVDVAGRRHEALPVSEVVRPCQRFVIFGKSQLVHA